MYLNLYARIFKKVGFVSMSLTYSYCSTVLNYYFWSVVVAIGEEYVKHMLLFTAVQLKLYDQEEHGRLYSSVGLSPYAYFALFEFMYYAYVNYKTLPSGRSSGSSFVKLLLFRLPAILGHIYAFGNDKEDLVLSFVNSRSFLVSKNIYIISCHITDHIDFNIFIYFVSIFIGNRVVVRNEKDG